jgi:hypothetical protein
VKTFSPVNSCREWTGRLTGFADGALKIDLAAVKQKGKKAGNREQGTGNREQGTGNSVLEIALSNVEKANLVVEI